MLSGDGLELRNSYLGTDVVKPHLDRHIDLKLHRVDAGYPAHHPGTFVEFDDHACVGNVVLELLIEGLKGHGPGIHLAFSSNLLPGPLERLALAAHRTRRMA